MKLNKKLSPKQFTTSLFLIFLSGLLFLGGLIYIINIQYQKPKNIFLNGPVTTPPKSLRLDLDQPDNDMLTFQSPILITGKTTPFINVLISADNNDLVTESKADGSFSAVLDLKEGVTKITVAVFDATGDSRSAERTIYYSEEKI